MSDREKFAELLDDLGIDYEFEGNKIVIDPFYVDGASEMVIKFYNGEDCPAGKFQEFSVYPEETCCPYCGRIYNA